MKKGSIGDGLVYHAGFPNSGEDLGESLPLSLDKLVVRRRASTFFWRIEQAIESLGWLPGTIAVVDRSRSPRVGDLVVIVDDDGFTVGRLGERAMMTLDGQPFSLQASAWGVVTYAVVGY